MNTKTMNRDEFTHFLNSDGWTHAPVKFTICPVTYENDNLRQCYKSGHALLVSEKDGITIKYRELFYYDARNPDMVSTTVATKDSAWSVAGVTVINYHGAQVSSDELGVLLACDYIGSKFSTISYNKFDPNNF